MVNILAGNVKNNFSKEPPMLHMVNQTPLIGLTKTSKRRKMSIGYYLGFDSSAPRTSYVEFNNNDTLLSKTLD